MLYLFKNTNPASPHIKQKYFQSSYYVGSNYVQLPWSTCLGSCLFKETAQAFQTTLQQGAN